MREGWKGVVVAVVMVDLGIHVRLTVAPTAAIGRVIEMDLVTGIVKVSKAAVVRWKEVTTASTAPENRDDMLEATVVDLATKYSVVVVLATYPLATGCGLK